MLETDNRVLIDLPLAMCDTGETKLAEEGLSLRVPVKVVNEQLRSRTLALLQQSEVKTAQDLSDLGCTGLFSKGLKVDDIKTIRTALEGTGAVVPCYVGLDRFCLAHNTIGGLQDGQKQRFVEQVGSVSRELLPVERTHVEVIESARRSKGGTVAAADVLTGRRLPKDFLQEVGAALDQPVVVGLEKEITAAEKLLEQIAEKQGGVLKQTVSAAAEPIRLFCANCLHDEHKGRKCGTAVAIDSSGLGAALPCPCTVTQQVPVATAQVSAEDLFKCPEHGKTYWNCRYCVAAEIVKGSFEPSFAVDTRYESSDSPGPITIVKADAVDAQIENLNEQPVQAVVLFVCVARWSRRLARE